MISVKLAVIVALLAAATVPAQRAMAQSVPSEITASVAGRAGGFNCAVRSLPLLKHTDPSFNPALAAQPRNRYAGSRRASCSRRAGKDHRRPNQRDDEAFEPAVQSVRRLEATANVRMRLRPIAVSMPDNLRWA